MVVCCALEELQELGAQIMTDLFESDGWEVRFLGGGLTNDDILAFINDYAPAILSIHGTAPKQAPDRHDKVSERLARYADNGLRRAVRPGRRTLAGNGGRSVCRHAARGP